MADFGGGPMTSDAGAVLPGATDRAIGLVDQFSDCFWDGRSSDRVVHDGRIGHDAGAIEALFVDPFLDAHERAPERLVLDLDDTDDPRLPCALRVRRPVGNADYRQILCPVSQRPRRLSALRFPDLPAPARQWSCLLMAVWMARPTRSAAASISRSPRADPPLRDSEKEPRPRHPVVPDGRADHIVRCSNTDKT